jgi:putative Ca2+/H+ antiporter (TMEM165/GDT1 family)
MVAFTTIFVAELGDKTQLSAMAMASTQSAKLSVFLGATLALAAVTLIAVIAGAFVGKYVSPRALNAIGGVLFLVFGAVMVYRAAVGDA